MRKSLLKALPMLFVGLLFALQTFSFRRRWGALMVLLFVVSAARGQIYVSVTGNDGNDGKSLANAKATLASAITVIGSETVPYIKLGAGTFVTGGVAVPQGVRVVGEGATQTTIEVNAASIQLQTGSSLSNLTITRSLVTLPSISVSTYSGSNNITVKNVRFIGNRTCIYLQGSNHVIVDNEFENNRTGLVIDPSGNPSVTGLVLERNRFYRNRSYAAIFLGPGDGSATQNVSARIAHNDFIGNLAGGIELNANTSADKVVFTGNYFDQTNNAILNQRTNTQFAVDDHNIVSSYPYNFTDNNAAADYPNAVSGANTAGITVLGLLNAAAPNGHSYGNPFVSSNSPNYSSYVFIQDAINYSNAGAVVDVGPGNYTLNSGVTINKSITLLGNGGTLNNKPLITGGDVTNRALIYVESPNVTISNLHLRFQESNFTLATTTTTAGYGIKSGATGSFNNLTITDNLIEGTNSDYVFNSAAVFLGVLNTNGSDNVSILRNKIGHTVSNNAFGRAVRVFNINGNIEANDLKAHYASIQAGDPSGGALIVNNNIMQGKLAMNGYVSAGNKITNNTITSGGTADAAGIPGADRQPALIEVISTTVPAATVEVSGNTLNDFKMLGIAVFYSSNVSVINNILNPLSGSLNTVGLYFDTKTTNSGTPGAKSFSNLIVKQNKFNAPDNLDLINNNNVGIKFANSYADVSLAPLTGAVIGGLGGDANTFDDELKYYIYLDNRPAGTKTITNNDPLWRSGYYYSASMADSDILPFSSNIVAEFNVFGSINTTTDRTQVSFDNVKTKINDKDDAVALGEVFLNLPVRNVNTGLGYATIQSAVDAATAGDEIKVDAGTYAEKIIVNKRLTIKGPNVGVAGSATRQAEAKIVPHVTDLGNTSASLVQFISGSDGSVFDGFEVNGNNSALTSGQVSKGEDIDAPLGVRIINAGKITIQNNVVRNFMSTAPTPFAYGIYSSAPTVSTNAYSEIVIKDNYVGNVQTTATAAYTGILLVNSYYAQISGNKVEDVRTAVQLNNFGLANPTPAFEPFIANNEMIASRGVYYNVFYGAASPWKITGNNISSASIANGSGAWFTGIRLETLQSSFTGGAEISNNIIDGKSAARLVENAGFDGTGLWFNNEITTTGEILVKDNNIGFVNNGILYNADNYSLTNNVKYVGGNIHHVVNNYVKYATAGTPVFSNIDLATTQLDGKTGGQYTSAELATIYTTKIIDKDDNAAFGKVTLFFNVKNVTRGTAFADIQSAIDDAATQNGDVVDVSYGTLTLATAVKINKSIILQGNFNTLAAKPIIKGTGNVTNKALFEIDAPNVTVSNFEFQIDQVNDAMIGISSTSTDNFNNLTIADNVFKGMKTYGTGLVWASHGIKLGRGSAGVLNGVVNNSISVVRNTITYNNLVAPDLFGRGIYAFNTYGKIGGSATDKNNIIAAYALQGGELGGGVGNNFEFSHNEVPVGLVSVVGAEAGSHKITANKIGFGVSNITTANGIVRMLEVKGNRTANANIEVSDNEITNYANIGIFIQRSDDVTIKNNTLTPFVGATSFNSVVFSTKEGTSGNQAAVTLENLTITGNTFNGSGVNLGTGIAFWNHNGSASIKPLTSAKIGGSDADKNIFAATLGTYIVLDPTPSGAKTLGTTMDRLYDIVQKDTDPDQSKINATNIFPFNGDVDASYNIFGAVNTGTETDFDNLLAVKTKIADGVDDPLTGYVSIQPQKAFIGAAAVFGNALTVVPEGFTLVLKNDDAVYHNLGDRTITKAFTFDIDNNTTAEIIFGNLTINAENKEVTFVDKGKANENFTLTEGKINAPLGFTLDATKAISFNVSKPNNYVNGMVTLRGVSAGASETIVIGNASVSTAVALLDPTGATASDFAITYTASAHANTANFNSANIGLVHNKEYWTINRLSGDMQAKVGLATYDFLNSGFTSFAAADAMIARYDGANWVSAGHTGNSVNGAVGAMTSASTSDFGAFTFAKAPVPVLPIALISFSAQATNSGALVKWSTANEENNAKFEVEKSLDGKDFFVIDTKAGKGNSITVSNYEFLDATFKQSAYYRLVDVSASGKRNPHTALTKFVKGLDNSLSVVAYPNPVTTKLFVSVGSANKENVKVSLVDLTGKTLKTKTADSSQPIELDVAGVATGSYILQVIKDSGNVSKKIVKL